MPNRARTLVTALCLPLLLGACASAARHPAPAAARAGEHQVRGKLFHHLRYHQSFPAERAEVLAALGRAAELDEQERAWLARRLPRGVYQQPAQVMAAVYPGKILAAGACPAPN